MFFPEENNIEGIIQNGHLIIKTVHDEKLLEELGKLGYHLPKWDQYYEFAPSDLIPGDWDLVRHDYASLTRKNAPRIEDIPYLEKPLPSFFHRIDDARIRQYFKVVKKGDSSFELANQLLESHPKDLYIRILFLDALLRKKDKDALGKKLTEWKEDYENSRDPFLKLSFDVITQIQKGMVLTSENRNGYAFAIQLINGNTSLEHRIKAFPGILGFTQYEFDIPYFIPPTDAPNFLNFQILSKLFKVQGIFFLLRGEREKALELFKSQYYHDLLFYSGDSPLRRFLGAAFRSLSFKGLKIYGLNCCETREELEQFRDILNELGKAIKEPDFDEILKIETLMNYHDLKKDMIMRIRMADTEFHLLRMAIAAKYYLLNNGKFPQKNEDFSLLLKQDLPKDPFGTSSLKFISKKEEFTCYSIGPDEKDQEANISYDPTNGAMSQGDIILKAPKKRTYPFPREGISANSIDDFNKIFPNELPPDPFADTKGKSLGIFSGPPLCIYSFGPDTDEIDSLQKGEPCVPEVLYDPTNGMISQGDFFITLPGK